METIDYLAELLASAPEAPEAPAGPRCDDTRTYAFPPVCVADAPVVVVYRVGHAPVRACVYFRTSIPGRLRSL